MKILITGSGGREHALAWKLAAENGKDQVFVAPGNAGTATCARNIAIGQNDFEGLARFIESEAIEMVVVGPEEPLVLGFRDFLLKSNLNNLLIVGPSAAGAQLEGSKDFAKKFMKRYNIPTAPYQSFTANELDKAIAFLDQLEAPYVLKADGLAAGKGVVIAEKIEDARIHVEDILGKGIFGKAGNTLVIESFLHGIEMSVFALTDGRNYFLLPGAKDYKRIGDGNTGPNTGGMGTVSPVVFADDVFMSKVLSRIIEPTIAGLQKEGIDYKGFIFFGLMNVNGDPWVIEYNARLGDPETQVIIPRIDESLTQLLYSAATTIGENRIVAAKPITAVSVIVAAPGYPGSYEKNLDISLEEEPGDLLFHAGTIEKEGRLVSNGGRILAAVGTGEVLSEAVIRAYELVQRIQIKDMQFRNDIGLDLMKHEAI